ncbi:hypothetical protein BDR04DRAFT_1099543 [Suillus decipiens]|nr:hypothetical protein BDR04DRAFT_1099543 [Suillus decipiens]
MIVVSNDPTWRPIIDLYRRYSQFVVAAFVVALYDWGEDDNVKKLPMAYKYF